MRDTSERLAWKACSCSVIEKFADLNSSQSGVHAMIGQPGMHCYQPSLLM